MLKQREWGIDKELLQIMQLKIKTIVQDARYMCCNGSTIKAIQKQYSVLNLTAKEQVREEGVVHMLKLDNEAGLIAYGLTPVGSSIHDPILLIQGTDPKNIAQVKEDLSASSIGQTSVLESQKDLGDWLKEIKTALSLVIA